jgi:hypothetical protein
MGEGRREDIRRTMGRQDLEGEEKGKISEGSRVGE